MQDVWSAVQGSLRERLGPQNYEIWIEPIQMLPTSGDAVRLRVPNRYYRDWVRENFGKAITEELHRYLQARVPVEFQVADTGTEDAVDGAEPTEELEPIRPTAGRGLPTIPGVSADKTFRNFVVGACNQFAHAAAQAAAEAPGEQQYNPLFIYGGTGLGKTHLMHAIGNAMRERDDQVNVVYVTAEQFTNELIDALRYRRMPDFRDRFRKFPDILLIDDVQFLSGKDRTQEELFHTFEDLYKRGKQIVFTADVLPREIEMLEPRLRTRCESGMLADTQPPDMETMVAILRQKSEDMELQLSPELGQWIAGRLRGNVRELEGVLNRLKAAIRLHKVEPSLEVARQHLAGILPEAPTALNADEIIQTVSSFYGLKVGDVKGTRRLKQVVRPRHVAMYLVRTHTELSFPDIGRVFGGRDHATVQHACKKIRALLGKDADLRNTVETIERMLVR
ncbi:chromosomal replication initiator protein DnaA [Myxococcota bacterium]|nr:chromosomal replication initiator protein DnaA [Myxococcota bacterium]